MKRLLTLLLSVLLALCLTGCGEVITVPKIHEVFDDTPAGQSGEKINLKYKVSKIGKPSEKKEVNIPKGKPRIINITLKEKVIIIPVGKTGQIEYTVLPKNAYDKSAYYQSSDEEIVKVDKDGKVLGLKPGAVDVIVRTNDSGFRRYCRVIVTRGKGDAEKSAKVAELINEARIKNGYSATTSTDKSLQAAADHRAFEEAVDMVNYGDTMMDNERMTEEKGKRIPIEKDIFSDFGIWSKSSKAFYIWGQYDAEQVYKAFIEDDEYAEALGVRGSGAESYQNFAVGYYEFDGITYWSILMTSE